MSLAEVPWLLSDSALLSPSIHFSFPHLAKFCPAIGSKQFFYSINGNHSIQGEIPHHSMVIAAPAGTFESCNTPVPDLAHKSKVQTTVEGLVLISVDAGNQAQDLCLLILGSTPELPSQPCFIVFPFPCMFFCSLCKSKEVM